MAASSPPQKKPRLSKVVLAIGSTLAVVGASVYPMSPTAGFYFVLTSTAIAHFAAYLGWGSSS